MVENSEALIASGLTSVAIAGTFLIAYDTVFVGQRGALALTVFGSSFALSYAGMKGLLPF